MSNLCCCEYLDEQGERNHILACCCNCQELDDGFESLITGNGINNQRAIVSTVKDRMRIPWLGGARQIAADVSIPILSIPAFILFATLNLVCTFVSAFVMIMYLSVVYKYYAEKMPRFFISWIIVSVVVLFYIFEQVVIAFLYILLEENIAFSICLIIAIYCAYRVKLEGGKNRDLIVGTDKTVFCQYCQMNVCEGAKHRFWLDSCISHTNHKYYVVCLISATLALVYSSNLTLTSVCHPFIVYWTILLPDDCSDVYTIMESSLSFVSALYSISLSLFFISELLLILKSTCLDKRRDNLRLCCRNMCSRICCILRRNRHN